MRIKLPALGAVLLTTAAGVASVPPATAGLDAAPSLPDVVKTRLGGAAKAAGSNEIQVNVTRRDGAKWAFGTAVALVPRGVHTYPQGWLFVAQNDGRGWQVGFEGETLFSDLATRAPVTSTHEKKLLGGLGVAPRGHSADKPMTRAANGDYRTGMRLPFAVGATWSMPGGPHGWGGNHTPYSSIDLAGGNGQVLAARGGTAYTMCGNGRGWIRVIHDRGYSTDYYHLHNNIAANGTAVSVGSFLGNIGTDISCGGSANAPHVHFALRQNGAYIGIADHNLGKWVPQNGAAAYGGSALHGSTRVYAGGGLYNYGALGFTQGIIDANGGGVVNKRTGPGTNYAVAGSVADGITVNVACSRNGTSHTGRWGTTSLWNKLSDGTWVTDAFMWTGMAGPINGTC